MNAAALVKPYPVTIRTENAPPGVHPAFLRLARLLARSDAADAVSADQNRTNPAAERQDRHDAGRDLRQI